jgi:hypothetical protein
LGGVVGLSFQVCPVECVPRCASRVLPHNFDLVSQ